MIGLTQKELATTMGISQSNVSKIELMKLEPSASDWYLFCQIAGLDAHKTLELGYIDGRKKFKHLLFEKSLLNLPLKYRQDFSLKVREIIPFKLFVIKKRGEEIWNDFLKKIKISPEIFFIYDFQLSFAFLKDLVTEYRNLGLNLFEGQGVYTHLGESHGSLTEDYQKKKKGADLIKLILENQGFYQRALEVNVHPSEQNFTLTPTPLVSQFSPDFIKDFTRYKIGTLESALNDFGFMNDSIEIVDTCSFTLKQAS